MNQKVIMMKIIREILLAWKWILLFGFLISLITSYVSKYVITGIFSSIILIIMFIVFTVQMSVVCTSVVIHRNITLNGQISFFTAFFTAFFTFLVGIALYKPIFNLVLYGKIFLSENEIPRRYYSNDEDGSMYEQSIINTNMIIGFLILIACCFFIAKVFSKNVPN
jgi:ABC-type transport system involved in multi-copper enzyme maturation permease subunit